MPPKVYGGYLVVWHPIVTLTLNYDAKFFVYFWSQMRHKQMANLYMSPISQTMWHKDAIKNKTIGMIVY